MAADDRERLADLGADAGRRRQHEADDVRLDLLLLLVLYCSGSVRLFGGLPVVLDMILEIDGRRLADLLVDARADEVEHGEAVAGLRARPPQVRLRFLPRRGVWRQRLQEAAREGRQRLLRGLHGCAATWPDRRRLPPRRDQEERGSGSGVGAKAKPGD